MGWATTTPGGRGVQIIKVTTLNADGPGSLLEALNFKGPRVIVFEVGGYIDLDKRNMRIADLVHGDVTGLAVESDADVAMRYGLLRPAGSRTRRTGTPRCGVGLGGMSASSSHG